MLLVFGIKDLIAGLNIKKPLKSLWLFRGRKQDFYFLSDNNFFTE
ncbi:hypothetical protein FEDK69T_16920 [Flavobacterium enshiense DK69]|nr:hypothetical protein FEDK69T_16920 [Flavobacterium enshiense DK69]